MNVQVAMRPIQSLTLRKQKVIEFLYGLKITFLKLCIISENFWNFFQNVNK